MRKTFATMLTMGLAAGVAAAQTPGSGVGAGGTSPANTQRPIGTEGAAGTQGTGGAGGATGSGGATGATGTGGATSSRGAAVGGTQGAGGTGAGGTSGTQGTAGSRGGTGTGTGAGTSSGRGGSLGGQGSGTGTGAAGSAGTQDLPGRGTRGTNGAAGTAGSATGLGSDTTRAGAASDPANAQMSTDMLFAAAAAVGGMAEVGTSRIAMERAGSDEIKQFAQRMVEDHTRANRELMALATQKGLQQPRGLDIKDQADVSILSSLRGEEFDKAYAKQQYASHICAVNQFTAEAQHGRDPELKAWAAKTLPAIKEHKMMIKTIVDRYEKAEQGDASPHNR